MRCSYYCNGYCFWNGDTGEVCDKIAFGTHKRIKDGYCPKEASDRELEEIAEAMIKAEEAKRREEEKTMRSIIQSINPEHVYNMHVEQEGEPLKRIEVRKTAPPTPLKFLYMEDVIFYDKPKELGEFRGVCGKRCINCNYKKYIDGLCDECGTYKLIRPPQSWCYAEA